MASEPITIYSSNIDPQGVLGCLRALSKKLDVDGPANNWSTITIPISRGLFRSPAIVNFGHDRSYYRGPDFPNQLRGMQGYFSRFPQNDLTPRIMELIASFRFAIALHPQPDPELVLDSTDERLKYLFAVVKYLDGVIFTPSSLRDSNGRVLYGGGTQRDPRAVLPQIKPAAPIAPADSSENDADDENTDPVPPSPARVARRALALAAVGARCLLEQEDPKDGNVQATRLRIQDWVQSIGIADELEPDESKLLAHPLGTSPRQDVINGVWRLEGLGVLAWALQLFELPPYDELGSPGELLPALGIFDADRANSILADPTLRGSQDLESMSIHILGLHWRLVDFRVRPKTMDFRKFAEKTWFGQLPLDGIRFLNNDLAIANAPIAEAPAELVSRCGSALQERHVAINWLQGHSKVYSKTDTST